MRAIAKPRYQSVRAELAAELMASIPVDRGSWQSGASPSPVYEMEDVLLTFNYLGKSPVDWARRIYGPPESRDSFVERNFLWAEDHHQERVSGEPLNPAPSYLDWPWHSEKYLEEYKGTQWKNRHNRQAPFDHTYPERMWSGGHEGLRFDYGDLADVITLLKRDPFTRQAFLPIWFPEDTGSTQGQRVPCTIGYHFIRVGARLQVKYFIRSCDLTRHLPNDIYMAGRLLQYVVSAIEGCVPEWPVVGDLTMFISNLHLFTADEWRYQ